MVKRVAGTYVDLTQANRNFTSRALVMEGHMVYPHVTEIGRAGCVPTPFPRTQRELVELSFRVNPTKTVRPPLAGGPRMGIFR